MLASAMASELGIKGGPSGPPFLVVRPAWAAARGCKSPVDQMIETTSRSQLRRREAGWEGRWRRNRDPRNTNRIEGETIWARRPNTSKPVIIKRPSRRCGGCARKVAVLIRGDLSECRPRRKSPDPGRREAAGHPAGVSRGRSSGGTVRREGPNAKPRQSAPVLAEATAANPASAGPSRNGRIG
jgi:hypothetical protein